jgi:alpha-glucosidase (family GH31 glycosyl hydrolase)
VIFYLNLELKYVPIIDPGIGIKFQYSLPFIKGIQYDVFIRSPYHGHYLLGKVWPGPVFFVDFLHKNADTYWHEMLENFNWKVPFDGVWLDMNELANFCDGECPFEEYTNIKEFYLSYMPNNGLHNYYKRNEPEYPYIAGKGKIFNATIRKAKIKILKYQNIG